MTDTDFILSRLRLTLGLQRLIRFGAARATNEVACRRLIPLVEVQYTGFNLPVRLVVESKVGWPGKIRNWFGKLNTLCSRKVRVIKIKWTESPMTRIVLHCVCVLRHGNFRWHWAGILRELRPLPPPKPMLLKAV